MRAVTPTKVSRDGKVVCRECAAPLGEVFRDPDAGDDPWWAEHANGEAAGFGPEPTRKGAVFLLSSLHECAGRTR